MIVKKYFTTREDGVNLYRSYSDINHYIIQEQTGAEYEDAIDVEDSPYTYIESDREIEYPPEEEDDEEEDETI